MRIENRYQCQIELYSEDSFEGWLAGDLLTGSDELVQLHLVHGPKATSLVHSIIERRAADLTRLNLTGYVPMINYGYDGKMSCYYFVYEQGQGPKLEAYIRQEVPSLSWSFSVLISLAQYLAELGSHDLGHGSLDASRVIVNPDTSDVQVMHTGLADLKRLAQADRSPDVGEGETLIDADVDSFLRITAEVLANSPNASYEAIEETSSQLPEEARDAINSLPSVMEEGENRTAFPRARRFLERVKRQIEEQDLFYATLTNNAVRQLHEMGFIREPRDYVAASSHLTLSREIGHEPNG